MTIENEDIGAFLKLKVEEYCNETNTDKIHIAEKLGVTPSAISSIFRSSTGTIQSLVRIAHACDKKGYMYLAELETNVPAGMFRVMERIFALPLEKQKIILEGLESYVKLALLKNND